MVLNNFNLSVQEGEFVAITGKSGSGKSTLLNIIGLLDRPTKGFTQHFGQKNVKPFSSRSTKLLKHKIGYLFQNFALVENESVYYNMELALQPHKMKNKREVIEQALTEVGLDWFAHKKVYQCSGGEQQRIAIARLLIKPCDLVLADEPTGSLDAENKQVIFDLLTKLHEKGKTLLVVTHDPDLVNISKRTIEIETLAAS